MIGILVSLNISPRGGGQNAQTQWVADRGSRLRYIFRSRKTAVTVRNGIPGNVGETSQMDRRRAKGNRVIAELILE